jgi:alpha-D-ribose 1-methylphosphonate 5-triphosphate synthase subunit PhnG
MTPDVEARRRWMSTLARASRAELEMAWSAVRPAPAYHVLRGPEVGLVMVRGRAGGSGRPFNLGEMTVTRCSVVLDGVVGHAWVAGRDERRAEIAAALDALWQHPRRDAGLAWATVDRLAGAQAARRRGAAARAGTTRVDFFTLVRGED